MTGEGEGGERGVGCGVWGFVVSAQPNGVGVVEVEGITICQGGEVAVDGLGMQEVLIDDAMFPLLQDGVDRCL